MSFQCLPNEAIEQVLHSLSSIKDLMSMSLTCSRLHAIINSPKQRFHILFDVAECQYGPLSSAIALVTHNSSQPVDTPREPPPRSLSLLFQIIKVGKIANTCVDLFPFIYWRGPDSSSRRLLRSHERFRVRRAVYRNWLYSLAFHNASFSRYTRTQPPVVRMRAGLLRSWSTTELGEMVEMNHIFQAVLEKYICPANRTIIRRHKERYGEDSMPTGSRFEPYERKPLLYSQGIFHFMDHMWEGWGDECSYYYTVQDMLKLHPGQVIKLFHFMTGNISDLGVGPVGQLLVHSKKASVELFIEGLGEWFDNNGATLRETIKVVWEERGDVEHCEEGLITA